jgi:hypothetical protein
VSGAGAEGVSGKGRSNMPQPKHVVHTKPGEDTLQSTPGTGKEAAASNSGSLKALKTVWFREGRCLVCGSEKHRRAVCPSAVSSPKPGRGPGQTATAPKGSKGFQNPSGPNIKPHVGQPGASGSGVQGEKRGRAATPHVPSGFTPPMKKASRSTSKNSRTSRFTYAQTASGAWELAILQKDGKSHISKKDFEDIQVKMNEAFFISLEKGERVPSVNSWNYTPRVAVVAFTCAESRDAVATSVTDMGFALRELGELMEERRPTMILSGLITGPTAGLGDEKFPILLKQQKQLHKIDGRLEVQDTFLTKGDNRIIRLLVDDVAMEGMKQLGYELFFAMSGAVLFQEQQKSSTRKSAPSDHSKLEGELAEIQRQRSALQEKMDEANQRIEQMERRQEPRSGISFMGTSGMDVAGGGDVHADDTNAPAPAMEAADANQ